MAGTSQVKAQIRLRFRNTNGVRMGCVRNIQVSKRRGAVGLTMKTLEGVLGVDDAEADAGSRATISTRCAELDQEMPLLLGVSRAILENVIFCHQEEASWPLAEPAALKKKFDDIFEAVRYTKALDAVRALRKQRLQDARVDEAELRALQQDKDRAESARHKIRALRAALDAKTRELEALDARIAAKTAANQELYDTAVRFRETLTHAESLEERLALKCEHRDALREHLAPLLEAPEEELAAALAGLPRELEAQRTQLAEQRALAQRRRDERDELAAQHDALIGEHGALLAARAAHDRALRTGEEEVRRLAAQHGVALDASPAEDAARFQALQQALGAGLEARMREARTGAEAADLEHAGAEAQRDGEWQRRHNELRDCRAAYEQREEAIRRLQERVAESERVVGAAAPAAAAPDEREALAARVAAGNDEALERAVAEADAALAELDAQRDTLTRQLAASNRHVEQRAALAHKERELARCRELVAEGVARIGEARSRSLGDVAPEALAPRAAQALQSAEREYESLTRARDAHRHTADTLEAERSMLRSDAEAKDARAGELDAEVRAALGGEYATAAEAVAGAHEEISILTESTAVLAHAGEFFQRILRHGQEKHVCLACNRALAAEAMPAFEAHVRASMQRSEPERAAALREELEAWQAQLARFQRAAAAQEQAEQLRAEAASLRAALAERERALREADAELRAAQQRTLEAHAALGELRSVHAAAAAVQAPAAAVPALQRDVDALRDELRIAGAGADVRAELEALGTQRERAQRTHAERVAERDARRAAAHDAESRLHALELREARARQEDAERGAARARLDEYRADLEEQRAARGALSARIEALEEPVRAARAALDAATAARRSAQEEGQRHTQALAQAQARLADVAAGVQEAAPDAAHLREREAGVRRAAARLHDAAREIEEAERVAHALELDVERADARERNLRDNLRLRQAEREIAQVEAELAALDLDTAHAHRERFTREYDAARREENEMNAAATHLRGELVGIRAELGSREEELRAEYQDVDERYVRKLIHIKVASMSNVDLDKYCGALQQAILQYHAIKMEEVNQTLDYLWKKTYQGTDIDSVLIRSDTEGKVTAGGTRSYQYRVCMVKDGVEMDMRGRCSAGQKVLACILIRLALADSFGSNCGFLALDEPTTNLDRENVEALAASLVDLIAERRHQRNFQLIVITHDEDFLSRLSQSDALSEYWRVSRDEQLNSTIEREVVRHY